MKINIHSDEMRTAWEQGVSSYVPIYLERSLTPEASLHEASEQNLLALLNEGLQIRRFLAGSNQGVLVEFANGDRYLATGFGWGYEGNEVAAFAHVCQEAGFGTQDDVFFWLVGLPRDLVGEIPLEEIPPAPSEPLN